MYKESVKTIVVGIVAAAAMVAPAFAGSVDFVPPKLPAPGVIGLVAAGIIGAIAIGRYRK